MGNEGGPIRHEVEHLDELIRHGSGRKLAAMPPEPEHKCDAAS